MAHIRDWLIYGANGYTGELIARAAAERGLAPVLAGRSVGKVEPLARELGLRWRAFDLASPARIATELDGIGLVLHCAGPFSATSAPMIEGCLKARVHYLDITGEIDVFEHAYALDERARSSGVVLCPGVGFDVIPTDCVAAALAESLPDATHLALGFDTRAGMSPGTLKTSIEGIGTAGRVRRDGRIVRVGHGRIVRRVDFGAGEKDAAAIPWGDVASAYRTTGIPNIEVFIPTSRKRVRSMRLANAARPILRLGPVRRFLQRRVERTVPGPSAEQRARHTTFVWGEAVNAAGARRTARITTANGYDLTVAGALAAVDALLADRPAGGAYTPSQLLGADLVTRLPGSGDLVLS
ncbi:saccharopine dehydrogenase family protein [Hamadaea tsunoensis]|uniref:saccharopine dehydrogenase family protein n=1 Tax=Hamadaea tsunoensis TaxID=53368 RepID=UPI0004272360|nr:saccharopine dehydrogenase NADP-binding domain-containing protein [Hamadaea tsunoensis]